MARHSVRTPDSRDLVQVLGDRRKARRNNTTIIKTAMPWMGTMMAMGKATASSMRIRAIGEVPHPVIRMGRVAVEVALGLVEAAADRARMRRIPNLM
jgi:hypothetical protein